MPTVINLHREIPRQMGNTTLATCLWTGAMVDNLKPLLIVPDHNLVRWTWDMRVEKLAAAMPWLHPLNVRESVVSVGQVARNPRLLLDAGMIIIDGLRECRTEWVKTSLFQTDFERWVAMTVTSHPKTQIILLGA